jgi:hypothetical protein
VLSCALLPEYSRKDKPRSRQISTPALKNSELAISGIGRKGTTIPTPTCRKMQI